MDLISHPLSREAIAWASSALEPPALAPAYACSTRDVLRARIDSLTIRLLKKGMPEDRARLLEAVLSEIGGNSFDHNLGQWRDVAGVFFGFEEADHRILAALADRGQGVLATLQRVRHELQSDTDALRVAFTEQLSGRAPEQRGNGLKFVRRVLIEDGIDLWFASGTASYGIVEGIEQWGTTASLPGCCAILSAQS